MRHTSKGKQEKYLESMKDRPLFLPCQPGPKWPDTPECGWLVPRLVSGKTRIRIRNPDLTAYQCCSVYTHGDPYTNSYCTFQKWPQYISEPCLSPQQELLLGGLVSVQQQRTADVELHDF